MANFYEGQRIETNFGHVTIRRCDGDYVYFMRYKIGTFLEPICSEIMRCDEFIDTFINSSPVKFIVYSQRRYGQPKLDKPKELKGVKQSLSVDYCTNCKCQCYIVNDDLWIKHRDWFSRLWQPPAGENIGMPQNYYLEKCFGGKIRPEKFVYSDNWGGIVLRNEAWLKITGVITLIRREHPLTSKTAILQAMATELYIDYIDLCVGEWERFWESVVSVVMRK